MGLRNSSSNISPGVIGDSFRIVMFLSVIVGDLDVFGANLVQRKHTRHWSLMRMLCCPTRFRLSASSRLPGWYAQVVQRRCQLQLPQLAAGNGFDIAESPNSLPGMQCFGLAALEGLDHLAE